MNLSNFQEPNEEEDNSPTYRAFRSQTSYKQDNEVENLNKENFSIQAPEEANFFKKFATHHDKFHSFNDWVEKPREDPSIIFYEKLKNFEMFV